MLRTSVNRHSVILAGVVVGLFGSMAAAQSQYFDVNSATAGSGVAANGQYSWEDSVWSPDSTGLTGNAQLGGTLATQTYIEGEFARFSAGTDAGTNAYTITANANHSTAGMFVLTNGGNVTVNGTGIFSITAGTGPQGFLANSGRILTINSVLSGVGGVAPGGAGTINLYAANTYTGGTLLAGTTLTQFNNNASFGTGAITLSLTNATSSAYSPFLGTGGAPITLANNFNTSVTAGVTTAVGINFGTSVNTPITSTGNWTLGATTVNLRNNGGPTSPLTLTGVISGTAGVTLSANANAAGQSLTTFGNVNSYTGVTTVGITGSANVKLRLAAAGAIASSSSVVLAGGTLDPDAINQIMSATTLGLTASSAIDYSVGASEVDFANSAGVAWTASAKLNLVGFNSSIDKLRFGTDANGLTATQLAQITVGGAAVTATLDANGFLVVPEPTSLALLGLGGLAFVRRRRAVR